MMKKRLIPLIISASALFLSSCGAENKEESSSFSSLSSSSTISTMDLSQKQEREEAVNKLKKSLLSEAKREKKGYVLTQNEWGDHFSMIDILVGSKDSEDKTKINLSIDVNDKIIAMSEGEGDGYISKTECLGIDITPQISSLVIGAVKNQNPNIYVYQNDLYLDLTDSNGMITALNLLAKSYASDEIDLSSLTTKTKIDLGDASIFGLDALVDMATPMIDVLSSIMEEDSQKEETAFKYEKDTDGNYSITYKPSKEQSKKIISSLIKEEYGDNEKIDEYIEKLFSVIPEGRDYLRSDFSFAFTDEGLSDISVDLLAKADENSYDKVPMLGNYLDEESSSGLTIGLAGLEASFVYTPIKEEEVKFSLPDDLSEYKEFKLNPQVSSN